MGASFAATTNFIWGDTFADVSATNTENSYALFRSREPLAARSGTTELLSIPTTITFRTAFSFDADPDSTELTLDCLVDDGVVVYLNGEEVLRHNVDDGPVDADTLAAERGIAISAEDILRRAIIEQLMCNLAVDLDALCDAHGFPPRPFEQELNALEALRRDGLVEIEGPHIAVTEPGRPLLRVICAAFDTYLESAAARHSRAV